MSLIAPAELALFCYCDHPRWAHGQTNEYDMENDHAGACEALRRDRSAERGPFSVPIGTCGCAGFELARSREET